MFRKAVACRGCKLPVSVDAKPFDAAAAVGASAGPRHVGHEDHAHAFVQSKATSSLFGGSFIAAAASALGLALFGLTYGYHIAKPVYDAYQKSDDDDEDGDDGSD